MTGAGDVEGAHFSGRLASGEQEWNLVDRWNCVQRLFWQPPMPWNKRPADCGIFFSPAWLLDVCTEHLLDPCSMIQAQS